MPQNKINWDKVAEQYDTYTVGGFNPAYFDLMEFAQKKISQIPPGSLVGDIGGGTANFSLLLAELFPESQFVVLDNAPQMMDIGREKARTKGITNIDFIEGDADEIVKVTDKYQRGMTNALMVHALYITGGIQDEQPRKILSNIHQGLEDEGSRFLLMDINRQLDTNDWIKYSIKNGYSMFRDQGKNPVGAAISLLKIFMENDQAKYVNRMIDQKQRDGEYLICDLNQLEQMVTEAGFSKIYESNDHMYRGRDNIILAGK